MPVVPKGTVDNPQAAPGHMCIYEGGGGDIDGTFGLIQGTDDNRSGVMVYKHVVDAQWIVSYGTWAVTAP